MTAGVMLGEGRYGNLIGTTNLTTSFKSVPSLQQSFQGGSGLLRNTTGLILVPERCIQYNPEKLLDLPLNDDRSIFKESGFGKLSWLLAYLHKTSSVGVYGIDQDKLRQFPFNTNLDISLKKLQVQFNTGIIYDLKESL